jgi:predicted flavoprotein YhiN
MMAAARAAQCGAQVTLFEKMPRPGSKLLLTGNGRCNLTNATELDSFISMFGPNGRFLYPAFRRFFRPELLGLLAGYGIQTITEDDGRIFPATGRADTVLDALQRFMAESGVQVRTGSPVTEITSAGGRIKGIRAGENYYAADAVVLAAGGSSYPQTGSDGGGFRLAASLGHSIVVLRPALVPLVVKEKEDADALQGITLPDVRLTALACPVDKITITSIPAADTGRGIAGRRPRPPVIESRRGGLLFTHYGLSGPAALRLSLAAGDALHDGPVSLAVSLLPSLDAGELERELQSAFTAHGGRLARTALEGWLPVRLARAVAERAGIPDELRCSRVSAAQRAALVKELRCFSFTLAGTRPLAEAMVTAGGVSLREVEPRNMQSLLARGLFICGEVLDIDAETGGFNLQAAFSTGWLAGESAAAA